MLAAMAEGERSGRASTQRALAGAAAFAGAAALAYETLWTRLLGLALGHEQLGVLSVLAGFFAGMALGAALAHRHADRLRRPARVFALLHVAAAAYALGAPWLLSALARWLPAQLGLDPPLLLSLSLAALVLLPATLVLGASLPVLIAVRRRLASDDARGLARLYALDTLGATAGVLLTIHLLLPRFGFVVASVIAAAVGLAAVGAILVIAEHSDRVAPEAAPASEHPAVDIEGSGDPDGALLRERWLLYLAIAATGLLGLGLEVVAVRVLAQLFSGTIYSFADLLAVWLLGTAAGTALHAKFSRQALGRRPATVLFGLLLSLAVCVALTAALARATPAMLELLAPAGSPWGRRQLAEMATAAIVLGPATLPMGACFAHLLALIAAPAPAKLEDTNDTSTGSPRAIGGALALNGLAAAAAPFVFGVGVLGRFDYLEAWTSVAWGYLILALLVGWLRRFPPRALALAGVGGGLAIIALSAGAGSLVLVEPEGERWTLLERREATLGVVSVSETRDPELGASPERPLRRLRIDRHFRMGGAHSIGERRMGHLPLLLGLGPAGSEDPQVLFLGLGTGATAGAALDHDIAGLTAVELVPEVVEMLPYFEAVNAGLAEDPRARIVAADARRFLLADDRRYRVIVADLFHPARDGAGSLYAREHFAAARERLTPGGLFVQWLPLYQLDGPTLKLILRSFLAEFPEAHAWLALYNVQTPALGLFGAVDPLRVELGPLRRTLEDPARADEFVPLALTDHRDLLAGYLLDRPAMVELAGQGPLNTDLQPLVDLRAPKAALGPTTGLDNLGRVLAHRVPWPDELVLASPEEHAELRAESAAFAEALQLYLEGEALRLRAELEGRPTQTRELLAPYLAAYRRAPDFLPPRPRLYVAAAGDRELGEWLLPAMLARTPDELRVHRAWLAHLARAGDEARFEAALAEARARFGDRLDSDPGRAP